MCDPVTIAAATFITSAASTGLTYMGEQQRFAATEQFRLENAREASRAYNENVAQLSLRRLEEDTARAEEQEGIRREVRVAQGQAAASAGPGSGRGLALILQDLARGGGRAVNTLEAQERFATEQYHAEVQGARAQALNAINAARPYIPTSTPLTAAVGVAQAGLQGATSYYQLRYLQQNPGAYRIPR